MQNNHGYKAKGLPAYVVLDTSGSMEPFEQKLNDTLDHIYDTLDGSPQLADFIHLSVISFNTMPHLVTPITGLADYDSLPRVACGGMTNFGPLFRMLRDQIEADVPALHDRGIQVLRPVVFLLTDGAPSDEPEGSWEPDLKDLQDPAWKPHPHIITYGFSQARAEFIARIATVAAFAAEPGAENSAALSAAMSGMLNSLVASGRTQQLQVPEEVQGYRSVPLDHIDP
jgi:uncharacterized protein YegL